MRAPTNWSWSRKKELAAKLLAEGGISATEIARQLGVARETVRYWKRAPEFQARIDQHLERVRVVLSEAAIKKAAKTAGLSREATSRKSA